MSAPPLTKIAAIPSVPSSADAATRQFLTAVKNYIEVRENVLPNATVLDKGMTLRDVLESGLGAVNIGGRILNNFGRYTSSPSGLQVGDYTPPPVITGFTASAAIMSIILSWNAAPASANIASYEIWRSGTNNIGVAIRIGTTPTDVYTDSIGAQGVTYYYWIRAVSRANVIGPFNAVAGTSATTGFVPSTPGTPDTTPPGAPSALSTTGLLKNIFIRWVNPAEYDVSVVEIWRNTVNDRDTSTRVGESRGTTYFDATVGSYYYWVRALDSQTPPNVGPFNAAAGATGTLGASVTITSATATTYFSTAAIDDAIIANLNVGKLVSGTISTPTIYLGDTTFTLDGPTRLISIKDQQGTPVTRVELGKLGVGPTDYGIIIRDSAGAIVLGANGLGLAVVGNTQLQNLSVDSAKVASLTVDKLRTGTFGAYQINVGSGQVIIDGADSTIKIFDTQATPVNRVKIGKLGALSTDYGIEIRKSDGSLLIDASGLGLNVAGNANISDLAVNKLLAGTIGAQQIYLGNTSFLLDGSTKRLTISDGTYSRVQLGDLGAGAFGLTLRDASGNIFLDAGGYRPVNLVPRGQCVVTGNSIQKVGGAALWDSDTHSASGFTGGAYVSAQAGQTNLDLMFSLNTDPLTDQNFTSLDYAIYFASTGVLFIYENGVSTGSHGAYLTTDIFSIAYDGATVTYQKNGVTLRSVSATIPGALYFDSSFEDPSAKLNNIVFRDLPGVSANRITAGTISASISIIAPTITGGLLQTSATGKRIALNESGSNEARFYGDRGDGIIEALATIGISTAVADLVIGNFGSAASSRIAVRGESTGNIAIYGYSSNVIGVRGHTSIGIGVHGLASAAGGIGVVGQHNTGTGIRGESTSARGVWGVSSSFYGVNGVSTSNSGVRGESNSNVGVIGYSVSSVGVWGVSDNAASYDHYANGAGANYGPFTAAHDGLVSHEFIPAPGDIVRDKYIVARKNISNAIAAVDYTLSPKDAAVIGVVVGHSEITENNMPAALIVKNKTDAEDAEYVEPLAALQAKYNRITMNAVGEGLVNVCSEGGDILQGDFLCSSSVQGKAMKQDDNIYRNYTVAKSRESVSWEDGDNSIKQIACIFLSG